MQRPPECKPRRVVRDDVGIDGVVVRLKALPRLAARVADVADLIAARLPVLIQSRCPDALVVVGDRRSLRNKPGDIDYRAQPFVDVHDISPLMSKTIR